MVEPKTGVPDNSRAVYNLVDISGAIQYMTFLEFGLKNAIFVKLWEICGTPT